MKASERAKLRDMFDGRCAYCGEPLGERWHADHVEPIVRELRYHRGKAIATGKLYRPENARADNLFPACAPCNIDKGSMPLEAWRTKLARTCDVLRRGYPTYRHALRFGLVQETGAAIVFYFEKGGNTQ